MANHRLPTLPLALAAMLSALSPSTAAVAATVDWKGRTWQVTSGGMAGACEGAPENVSVDANGYLHLNIANRAGKWAAAEIFSTERLGFGTYQWHVDGPIDTYDKNVVLGLFPYGPAGGIGEDGTNEIDIEYSRWGKANGPNADYTDYPGSGTTIGELAYTFTLGGATLSTSRFVWTPTSITSSLMSGLVNVGAEDGLLKTWSYQPNNPVQNIPQQALPLGMNLWCFDGPPSDSKPVEIVVRDFTFVPANAGSGGGAAGGGAGGLSGAGGDAGTTTGGAAGTGTTIGGRRGATDGGDSGTGGSEPNGGIVNAGSANTNGGVDAGAGASRDGARAGQASDQTVRTNAGCGCALPGTERRGPHELGLVLLVLAVAPPARRLSRRRCIRPRP